MSSSTTDRSESQNNSERPSSRRTSTAACSDGPQRCRTVPRIPAKCLLLCPSLTRTTVPLRASLACKSFSLPSCSSWLRSRRHPRPSHHPPGVSRFGWSLHRSQFVEPEELDASVLEAHVHRQVVGMTVCTYYRAKASLPRTPACVQHPHRRTDTRLTRFQEVRPLSFAVGGRTPFAGEDKGADPNGDLLPARDL